MQLAGPGRWSSDCTQHSWSCTLGTVLFWAPAYEKDGNALEHIQRKAAKKGRKGLDHKFHGDGWGNWDWLFNLKKGSLGGRPYGFLQLSEGRWLWDEWDWSLHPGKSNRATGNGIKSCLRRFRLVIREHFFRKSGNSLAQAAQAGSGVPSLEVFKKVNAAKCSTDGCGQWRWEMDCWLEWMVVMVFSNFYDAWFCDVRLKS